ncbi:uncharacterized protein LOC133814854 [Humulus lupulus]|uniref:uncharacterized protein LOC133814854 n=1 Tax=Humulus lupulus TaxID=3486 RepID=UPI002B40C58C|nr:uncharacterized protein LOC133814854 [Humulus lupulus]
MTWDTCSDHCYCVVKKVKIEVAGIKPFRYFNYWQEHDQYKSTVLNCWARPIIGRGLNVIMGKLNRLKHCLKKFNRRELGVIPMEFQLAKDQFIMAQNYSAANPTDGSLIMAEKEAQRHFEMVNKRLNLKQQLQLVRPFSRKDVRDALFSIPSVKSLGPDGYGAGFFKGLWSEIGNEIADAILDFFKGGLIPNELNKTVISLIPKIDSPSTAIDYRPIACCNTLYKCISKMIYSRLSEVLACLVHDNQGAFIKNRLLAHNILIFQDLLKGYTRKNISARCLIKVDLSKAYDTVDWDFVEDILHGNGTSLKLVLEAFDEFGAATGLSANASKSSIYFGGIKNETKYDLLRLSKIAEGSFPLKYLGVNLRPTKWKASDCEGILSKFRKNLHGWSSRHLSFSGRCQLIHSILLGIRNYWMGMFILPQKITTLIDKMCRDFLWGCNGNRSKLHFCSWEHVCLPKDHGGLGFREGKKWNIAMMSKYIWAVSTKQDSLWVRWVNATYMKNVDFWFVTPIPDASWYFKKMLKLRGCC